MATATKLPKVYYRVAKGITEPKKTTKYTRTEAIRIIGEHNLPIVGHPTHMFFSVWHLWEKDN